jgi:signal transduction histidine kinase
MATLRVLASDPSFGTGPDLTVDVTFGPEALRREIDLHPFIDALRTFPALAAEFAKVRLILAELLSNAVEHAVLRHSTSGLESSDARQDYYERRRAHLARASEGRVHMSFSVYGATDRPRVTFRVEDSSPHDRAATVRAHSGRGLALVRALCSEVVSRDGGSIVEAEYAVTASLARELP